MSEFSIAVDNVSSSDWSSMLDRFDDANPYQTWTYGAVHWGAKNLSHLVLRRAGAVVAIVQVRIIRPRFLPGGVAYVRWGPMVQLRGEPFQPAILDAAVQALYDEYVCKRKLFLRILPDAFVGSERASAFNRAFATCSKSAQTQRESNDRTFVLDLSPSLEDLRKKLDQKWRNQLNRAEKNGLTLVQGNSLQEYDIFLNIYNDMWSRKKFETSVDVQEFRSIADQLPPSQKFRTLICVKDGVPVSGIVCSAVGSCGIYLLGATNDKGLDQKGAYLLQWTMIRWLKENGFRSYDLGGIDPEKNPGVYHFKRGFSAKDVFRMAPLEACESLASSCITRSAEFVRATGPAAARSLQASFRTLLNSTGIIGRNSATEPVKS